MHAYEATEFRVLTTNSFSFSIAIDAEDADWRLLIFQEGQQPTVYDQIVIA
jgi:hypothetical protein